MPGGAGQSSLWEQDSGYVNLSRVDSQDPNAYYGRVVYTYGLALDQPISIARYGYADFPNGGSHTQWPAFAILPFWDLQGRPLTGAFGDGAAVKQLTGGGTQCPNLDTNSAQRCVMLYWPFSWSAYDQRAGIRPVSWHGTMLDDKRDHAGTSYRRNRVYDPATGRFTQEDPIGLAGGLNLYGFADGDPVNFSDPFGLCPFTRSDASCYQELADWGAKSGRGWAVTLGAALEAGAVAADALMGGGCGGDVACGMGVPGSPRGLLTGAKHVVSEATRRITASYTDNALLRVYRGAIAQINRHKEILKKASPEQVNSINKDIVKHEKRLQAAYEEMQRRRIQP